MRDCGKLEHGCSAHPTGLHRARIRAPRRDCGKGGLRCPSTSVEIEFTRVLPVVVQRLSIKFFMDESSSGVRRVMAIVSNAAGVLHKLFVPGPGDD